MSDLPEWAMEEARVLLVEGVWLHSAEDGLDTISRALVKAHEKGIAEERARKRRPLSEPTGWL